MNKKQIFERKRLLKYELKNVEAELKTTLYRIKKIQKFLTKNASNLPQESLRALTKKRQKYLQNYNDAVFLGFQKDIQYAQKKLHHIIHKEILASRLDELKLLFEKKNTLQNEKFQKMFALQQLQLGN